MSANGQNSSHDAAHSGPVKTPKQGLVAGIFAFVVPVFVIIGLVQFVTSANKPAVGAADPEKAVAERIQKIGIVEVRDANRTLQTGEEVFKAQCITCHGTGALGSPKFQDAAAWGPRIGAGYDALLNSALKGKNSMPAQGGGNFSELEVGRAVVYMANAGGAKFAEPKAPAAADAAAPAAK